MEIPIMCPRCKKVVDGGESSIIKCPVCYYTPDTRAEIEQVIESAKNQPKNYPKNRIKCQGCGSNLNASGMQPRSTAACPSCGNTVSVPFPGMTAGKFFALYCLVLMAGLLIAGLLGEAGLLVIPFWFAAKLSLGYQRAINIGWHPVACLWVMLPFLGALVLSCYKTGAGVKVAR